MNIWGIILLGVDMVLMGGIIFILLWGRRINLPGLVLSGASAERGDRYRELVDELNARLDEVRKTSEELERERRECDRRKKELARKSRLMDTIIEKSGAGVDESLATAPSTEDVFARAMRMRRMGRSPEEISSSLGILDGEMELISSLNSLTN